MKRFLCLFIMATTICCLSACHKTPASSEEDSTAFTSGIPTSTTDDSGYPTFHITLPTRVYPGPYQTFDELMRLVDNSSPYNQKLKTEIDQSLLPDFASGLWPYNSSTISALDYQDRLPIELIRTVGEEFLGDNRSYTHGYTMNKVKDGGILYAFYAITDDNGHIYFKMHNAAYVERVLTYADFADIKIGDPIDKVIALDPIARFTAQRIDMSNTVNGALSIHLLKDGVLFINYNNSDKTVKRLRFSDNFQEADDPNCPYRFDILPQDWPMEKAGSILRMPSASLLPISKLHVIMTRSERGSSNLTNSQERKMI